MELQLAIKYIQIHHEAETVSCTKSFFFFHDDDMR